MKKIYPSELHARVSAVNDCNRAMRILAPLLYEIVERFGKQKLAVIKADGTLMKRFRDATHHLTDGVICPGNEVFISNGGGRSLWLLIRRCEAYGNEEQSFATYGECQWRACSITDRLPDLITLSSFRREDYLGDHTVAEVVNKRKELQELENSLARVRPFLEPFTGARETF